MGVCCGKDKGEQKPFRPGEDVMRRQDEEEEKEAALQDKGGQNPDGAATIMPLGPDQVQAIDGKDQPANKEPSLQNLPSLAKKNPDQIGATKNGQVSSAQNLKDGQKQDPKELDKLNRLNTAEKKLFDSPDQGKDSSLDESFVKKLSQKNADPKIGAAGAQNLKKPGLQVDKPNDLTPKLKQGEKELMIDVPDGTMIKAEELHQANFNSQNSKSRSGPPLPHQLPSELGSKAQKPTAQEGTPKAAAVDKNRPPMAPIDTKPAAPIDKSSPSARRVSIDQHVAAMAPHLAVDPYQVRISSDHLSGVSPPGSGVLAAPNPQSSLGAAEGADSKKNHSLDRLPPGPSQLSVAGRSIDSPPKQTHLGMRGLKSVFTINEITEPDPTIIAGDGLGKPSAVSPLPAADEVIGSESVHIKLSVNQGDRTDQNLKMIPDQQLNVVSFKPNFFNTRQVLLEAAWPATHSQQKEEAKELAERKKYEEIHEMVRADGFNHSEQPAGFDDGWATVHGEGETIKET